jgi:D-glycero-alpha-D-manno-heptose-7-phosphate kinase
MIVVQTPLRISFFGGGTDFRGFYRQEEGCVLSSAIDKCIFVVAKHRFDAQIRLGYTRTEVVDRAEDLKHELAREALLMTGLRQGLELLTIGDIPSAGTGLGSSSTVTVGLLHALYVHRGERPSWQTLARQACEIEIERLGKPIGKQDQYIAACGGLRFIRFLPDESVITERVALPEEVVRRLNERLVLVYTNTTRRSETVLDEQVNNIPARQEVLRRMKALAHEGRALLESGDLDAFGALLHEGWVLKKQLASKISNGAIDEMYGTARRAGAFGGKITGAGGGGFLLLYCPCERREAVCDALRPLEELPFRLEPDGTKVIFDYRR